MIIIDYLHYHHLIYRDLKPDNIMLDTNGNIILIDLDRMVEHKKENIGENSTRLIHIYCAPEITENMTYEYDYSSDIYSLGLIIYYIIYEEMLCQKVKRSNICIRFLKEI